MKITLETQVVNTTKQIADVVDWLVSLHPPPFSGSPIMYIDLEGVGLSRHGSVSILTLLVDTQTPNRKVYLIDVHTLAAKAFNTSGVQQKTLKDILQDKMIPKVFFDVRNDSDALFAHYGVALQGVQDVQLMESATRKTTASRKFVKGLSKCTEENVVMADYGGHLASWKQAKEKGERLFKPEGGGTYEVFNRRPIPQDIVSYCVGDVQYLPELRNKFWRGRDRQWEDLIREVSMKRVSLSQEPAYQPYGQNRAVSPWSRGQHEILDKWNSSHAPQAFTGYAQLLL